MNEFRYALSLRAVHPKMCVADIETALSMQAWVGNTAGEQRKTPKGNLLEGLYKNSYCSFELSKGASTDLNDQIGKWNAKFFPKKSFFQGFAASGGKFDYFLGLFLKTDSGFELSTEEMHAMQELRINLVFDIYPDS